MSFSEFHWLSVSFNDFSSFQTTFDFFKLINRCFSLGLKWKTARNPSECSFFLWDAPVRESDRSNASISEIVIGHFLSSCCALVCPELLNFISPFLPTGLGNRATLLMMVSHRFFQSYSVVVTTQFRCLVKVTKGCFISFDRSLKKWRYLYEYTYR